MKEHLAHDLASDDDDVLTFCTVCRGAEASLPTECPGLRMSLLQQDRVQAGRVDYRGGEWVDATEDGYFCACGIQRQELCRGGIDCDATPQDRAAYRAERDAA